MARSDDHLVMNIPGQRYQLYVGFGNEIKMKVDTAMRVPPPTIYPERLGLVPFRPTAVMGPHRLGFVGEGVPLYGGYSHTRWRTPAINHQWTGTGNPTIAIGMDSDSQYESPQPAYALFTWTAPGVYEVQLTVHDDHGHTHTGKRQVIIYPSRTDAYSGVVGVSGLAGSVSQGGWGCQVTIRGAVDFILQARDLDGYIPVVVYVDTYYETTRWSWERKALGPNWHEGAYRDDPRILFSGYLDRESVKANHDLDVVTFEARTADLMLEQMQSGTYGFFADAMNGSGLIFDSLQTHDVARHMLQEHSTFADWHDVRFNQGTTDMGFDPGLIYKDWTWNQGVYWSNIRDMAANQYEHAYVSNHGAVFLTWDRNMWKPNMYERGTVQKVHQGPENLPLSVLSAEPIYGEASCVPLEINVAGVLSQQVSYYKIIGSLSFQNEEWGADHPKGAPRAASGRWVLEQGKYFSDHDRDHFWNDILWHWAVRGYALANMRYRITAVFGMHTYWRFQDIIEVIFTDDQGRVAFTRGSQHNWFEVDGISYDINAEGETWRTSYSLRELTVYNAPTPEIPAVPVLGKGSS